MSNKTYTLTLNERQARVVREALELYSRLGMGQFTDLKWLFDGHPHATPTETS